MAKITVDGTEYEAQEGRTILQALDEPGTPMNGVDIPHYCWDPKLTIDGSCRLCPLETEVVLMPQLARNPPIKDGL